MFATFLNAVLFSWLAVSEVTGKRSGIVQKGVSNNFKLMTDLHTRYFLFGLSVFTTSCLSFSRIMVKINRSYLPVAFASFQGSVLIRIFSKVQVCFYQYLSIFTRFTVHLFHLMRQV